MVMAKTASTQNVFANKRLKETAKTNEKTTAAIKNQPALSTKILGKNTKEGLAIKSGWVKSLAT